MQLNNKYIVEIFEQLSKGKFICSNSVDVSNSRLYTTVDEDFDNLYNYFLAIGFVLERGDEYFYFSRTEAKTSLEAKIEQAYEWVDVVDFFMSFDNGFAPGFRFTSIDLQQQVKVDANLKDKLEIMKRLTGEGSLAERINNLIKKQLVNPGYAESESNYTDQYKVMASYNYIKNLITSIQIQDEV